MNIKSETFHLHNLILVVWLIEKFKTNQDKDRKSSLLNLLNLPLISQMLMILRDLEERRPHDQGRKSYQRKE